MAVDVRDENVVHSFDKLATMVIIYHAPSSIMLLVGQNL